MKVWRTASRLVPTLTLIIICFQAWIYNEQRKLLAEQSHTSYITQRAYVNLSSIDVDFSGGRATLILENVGKTPADRITVNVMESRRYPMATDMAEYSSVGSTHNFEPRQRLFPGKMRMTIPLQSFQSLEIRKIEAKQETLHISGFISYYDGFGFPDTTLFGLEYDPSLKAWNSSARLINEIEKGAGH